MVQADPQGKALLKLHRAVKRGAEIPQERCEQKPPGNRVRASGGKNKQATVGFILVR